MENQVLSIEQMQHLKELGVDTSKASMHYHYLPTSDAILNNTDEMCEEPDLFTSAPYVNYEYPAFTFLDMLEMMPNTIEVNESECNLYIFFHEDGVSIYYEDDYDEQPAFFCEDSILESAYNMLCWLAENGYLNKK